MTSTPSRASVLDPSDLFLHRHLGPSEEDIRSMLQTLGTATLDELVAQTVPEAIRLNKPLALGGPRGEQELLEELGKIANENRVMRSCIGAGYYDTITPPVILRNIMENPCWYTQYTPYQAEISQGRLEALLNFQTMVADLTGLPLAGASLLDEGTAAAEAMSMCFAIAGGHGTKRDRFFVANDCHPQTIAVIQTRGEALGVRIDVGPRDSVKLGDDVCGVLYQYPTTNGDVVDYRSAIAAAKDAGATTVLAADLLALTLLTPPGELGADIAIGSAQRFGVPMGYGGPHAAYISTRADHARRMPGRIIGVSRDAQGKRAYRMAIQTREQHIRRERATSNICTAQALLAIMAGFYAAYHGPEGLKTIARRVQAYTATLARGLEQGGHSLLTKAPFFDTVRVRPGKGSSADVLARAVARGVNLRDFGDGTLGVSFDETTTRADVAAILSAFANADVAAGSVDTLAASADTAIPSALARTSAFLTHEVFHAHQSETDMLRYIQKLASRDLSLAQAMIPLGSCTMKLNATSEMIPVTWSAFGRLHPFAPLDQTKGYQRLFRDLETWLSEITGFAATTLQPNAGSQGEFAGLLVIRAYHEARGDKHRNVCLIPVSAHGTNPASAVVAGFKVVTVECDDRGNVDLADLKKKAEAHKNELGALMITYPSTHGVFETAVKDICAVVHANGGQVYMDGANMNAQVGLCRPGDIGADVCHLNLHKTFCIPHGGGGPGMGPICVAKHLAPFLPGHPVTKPSSAGAQAIGPISAAPYGSPSILTISWVYIALMGAEGLKRATEVAILNANYMAKRLEGQYQVVYLGEHGRCAHEFIVDCRPFKAVGIEAEDIAKRLMDYGFHAPTMSFPVVGTLMIEPTESEPRSEIDRLCDALIHIRQEIRAIEEGKLDRVDNPLKNAPHTLHVLTATEWNHKYPREQGAFPMPSLRESKFWPSVGRIDNPYGDRNLVCICPPTEAYAS